MQADPSGSVATWRDAVQEAPGGVRLLLEVTAGARDARFPAGHNIWRQGRIGIRVQAPAQEGKANAEVVAALAAFFGVPSTAVTVESGHLDPRKNLHVAGVTKTQATQLLAPLLEPA